jgi:hypothetical protein
MPSTKKQTETGKKRTSAADKPKRQTRKPSASSTAAKGKGTRSTAARTKAKSTNGAARNLATDTPRPANNQEIIQAGGPLVDEFRELVEQVMDHVRAAPVPQSSVKNFRELVEQGNISRIVIRHDGHTLMQVPLTAVAEDGALDVWAKPLLTAIAALAGATANVVLEIERID